MSSKNNPPKTVKLHPRNKNRERYDLEAMAISNPELKNYIQPNKSGSDSINFSDPVAVKILNKSILVHYYGIEYWDFPNENLCPAIPGRAEYIHHIADLLVEDNQNNTPVSNSITCLDIGTGASCIYPVIGATEYNWNFVATDIDSKSIQSAQNIIDSNPSLQGKVICRVQNNPKFIFRGIIRKEEKFDISICNPPFHSSKEDALRGTKRKLKNLHKQKVNTPTRNFSGKNNELIYKGGEYQFVHNMISESKEFSTNCLWFSSLISKESNLNKIKKFLRKHKPTEIRTINISIGNKTSRILAWTYVNKEERKLWHKERK